MSSVVSTIKGLGGLFGSRGGGVKRPKKQRELGRMSLAELTELRESLTGQITPLSKEVEGERKSLDATPEAGFAGVSQRRLSRRGQRRQKQLTGLQGRLGEVSSQISKLTKQRVGSRTARATAVSTLLGRRR